MPSTNKTTRLNLNLWTENDRPTRADFISDNSIIDNILGAHADNSGIHLTADEKTRVSSPYYFKMIQGTGEETRTITFTFEPQMVIYFALEQAPSDPLTNPPSVNWGIAVKNYGGTEGCELSGSSLIISHKVEAGIKYNLNNSNVQYIAVAFR